MKIFPAILCVAILAGCSSVTIKEPFPESPLTPKEQQELTGTWRLEESVIQIAFTGNGVPWMAIVEWKDEDFALNKSRLYFTRHNEALYVCMPAEPGETNKYFFAEIKPTDQSLVVWGPDADYCAQLVDRETLKGSVKRDKHSTTVSLETPAVEILELISTNQAAIDYKNPLLFQKLN